VRKPPCGIATNAGTGTYHQTDCFHGSIAPFEYLVAASLCESFRLLTQLLPIK
jgi:hypothetical protein